MAGMFDLKVFGDKELERAMARLPGELQGKVMRTSVRKSANRINNRILINASGGIVDEDTGRMVAAFEAKSARTKQTQDGDMIGFIKLPTRAELGIPRYEGDTEYYVTIVEHGSPTQPPRPFIRNAVDDTADEETRRIGNDIGAGAERIWERLVA